MYCVILLIYFADLYTRLLSRKAHLFQFVFRAYFARWHSVENKLQGVVDIRGISYFGVTSRE